MASLLRQLQRRVTMLASTASLATLAACGETTVNAPLGAGTILNTSSGTLSGVAGQTLAGLVEVRVLGTDNQPLAGATVTFTASAGGTASPETAATDADGRARTQWTLANTAGANTLTASAGTGATVVINATGTAGRAAVVTALAGNNQTAAAGAIVPIAPGVRVNDANGNPVQGVGVVFTVVSGGGQLTDAVRTTNAQGTAAVGSWILGTTAGTQTIAASVSEAGVTNNPIVFTATATAAAAAQIVALTPTSQSAPVTSLVPTPPSVKVVDVHGNGVANVQVAFNVTAGNGQITGNTQLSNAQGIATVGSWLLGNQIGNNELTVVVTGAPNLVFQATGTAGAPTQILVSAGNNQSVQAGRAVPVAPAVVVRDAQGNAASGVVVNFAVATGGGTVISGRQVTDAAGIAEVGAWFLGATPGTNTMTATVVGVGLVTFTATGTPGNPVSMVANSPLAQSAAVGAFVAAPPSVIVRDLNGNPVPGIVVTFAVTAGGGTIIGSPATTDVTGVATLTSWRLGTTAGANAVTASATGLPTVTFNATATAGAPANIVAFSGDNQTAVQGTAVTQRPTVRVTDANGNVVTGAIVTFAVVDGGGSITGVTQSTDAAGQATVGSWTLGNLAPNTVTATVAGTGTITGNPVTFTAQSATQIAITAIPAGPLTLGANFNVTLQLQNALGAPVALAGVPLTISIASGGGTLNGTLTGTTTVAGSVTFTVNVTGAAGARTFDIVGTGLTTATSVAITFN